MIPEDHRSEIVSAGIMFVRSITNAYGSDEGIKLWDSIMTTVDLEVKGAIFFAMISGHTGNQITIYGIDENYSDRIARIKAIRAVTGLGLKEAKDISDRISNGGIERIDISRSEGMRAMGELISVGFKI